ncbi:hypothetical protein V1277_007014 [Bradyrhizobium sp. AZCC 1588]|uniref:hypothetical protein n=1 Tax=unclassified Bradyrhizobium TaxID=2631580 RepID=UPI0030565CF1
MSAEALAKAESNPFRRLSRHEFANPVPCVKLANDGLLYVCDRANNRVLRKNGTFVKEWFYEKNTRGNGAVWDIAIWPELTSGARR